MNTNNPKRRWVQVELPDLDGNKYAVVTMGWKCYGPTNEDILYWSHAFLSRDTDQGFDTIDAAREWADSKDIRNFHEPDVISMVKIGASQQSVEFAKISDILNAQARPGQLMGIANIDAFIFV